MFKDFPIGTRVKHKWFDNGYPPGIIMAKGINPYSKKLVYQVEYDGGHEEYWEEQDIEPIDYYDFQERIRERIGES
jgi:hypothetical protein